MELKDLETFVTVVKCGSITCAADVLHVTQPGVSRRIDRLENALGCTLFERVGNHLLLTKEGKTLLPHAEAVLGSVRDLRAAVDAEKGGWTTACIAMSATLAETPFTDRLKELRDRFPALRQLHIKMVGSAEVSELVAAGEADVGFRFFRDKDERLEYVPLGEEPLVVIRAAHSRWFPGEDGGGEPLAPLCLNDIPWIAFPARKGPSSHITAMLDQWIEETGIRPGLRIDADCLAAQQKLVQADFGIALQPASSVQEAVERGKLRLVPLPAFRLTLPICAVFRKTAPHRDMLQNVIRLFQKQPE